MQRLLAPDRLEDPEWPGLVAVLVIVLVVVADVVLGDKAVLTGLLVAAPLLCGLTVSPTTTRAIATAAILVAVVSFIWNSSLGSWKYWVPLSVVAMASVAASFTAAYRQRLRRDALRMRLLADIAEIGQAELEVPEVAQRVCELLVPRLADTCAIELTSGSGQEERVAEVPASASPPASSLAVPLLARGQRIGTMALGTSGSRPRLAGPEDEDYAETISGRAALALANARLSHELSSTERQLEGILETVDAAITVRDTHGRMVYANDSAARLLKLPSAEAVKSQPPGSLMDRFDVYDEEGQPVDLADLPGTQLLAGEPAPPPVIVRNVVKETGEERWLLNKATAVTDSAGRVLMAVNLIEDITESKRSEIAQRLLAKAARELAEASDLKRTLQAIAEAAVPGLADWAGVDLVEPSGQITTVAVAHRDPEKVRLGWRLRTEWPTDASDEAGLPAVIRSGEPQLVRDIPDELLQASARSPEHLEVLRAVGLTSTMIAPIQAGQRVLGVLSFVSSTSRRFDERDLQLAGDLGRQAGVFINHAQLYAEQVEIAHTLQAGLVPPALPEIEGWELASAYRAAGRANEVGGDFYDVIQFSGGWAVVIGDVVGKGAEAAALTSLARHTLAAIIESTGDLEHAFTVLNRRLLERDSDFRSLCTAAAVTITGDGDASVVSAGHPLPLLRRREGVEILGTPSPMLGFIDDLELETTRLTVQPHEELLLYTDGVLDAVGEGERFGEERLLETLARLEENGRDAAAQLLSMVDSFTTGEQSDDIAIVSLRRTGVRAPSAPLSGAL